MLRGDVVRAMDEGMSNEDPRRTDPAKLRVFGCAQRNIARTETAFADSAGNMAAYRASGVVSGKRWITGAGAATCARRWTALRCRLMRISRTAAIVRRCIRNADVPVRQCWPKKILTKEGQIMTIKKYAVPAGSRRSPCRMAACSSR